MTTYLVGRLDRIIRRALEELIRDQDVSVVGYTAMSVLEAPPRSVQRRVGPTLVRDASGDEPDAGDAHRGRTDPAHAGDQQPPSPTRRAHRPRPPGRVGVQPSRRRLRGRAAGESHTRASATISTRSCWRSSTATAPPDHDRWVFRGPNGPLNTHRSSWPCHRRTGRPVAIDSTAARPATSGTRASWPLTGGGAPDVTLPTNACHWRTKLVS